jgi:hypothetical protein
VTSCLALLVNLIQGYIELSAEMLGFFFIFSLGSTIVGNNTYGDCCHVLIIVTCRLNDDVCKCVEVR